MKKRIFLFAAALVALLSVNAQTILKGDMNGDNQADVSDVTSLVNCILTGNVQTLDVSVSPYKVDNAAIVGTWSKSAEESITFVEDGTTDYAGAAMYKYMPNLGRVLFYNGGGVYMSALNVMEATADYLILCGSDYAEGTYWWSGSAQRVESITLSATSLTLEPGATSTLTATVTPEDAVIAAVVWSSSDKSVATVSAAGLVTAVGGGTCTITCTSAHGSGVSASCAVKVSKPHTYVNLGLPSGTLWATCNVGADEPYDYGDYFAWGETEGYNSGKTTFDWSTYKYCNGSSSTLTKYCTYSSQGTVDNKTILEPSDDAAAANWGGDWRMPTHAEWQELNNTTYCTWTWYGTGNADFGSKAGYKVESKMSGYEGNFIFLPAAGYHYNLSLNYAGSDGSYWSSSLRESNPFGAWYCFFNNSGLLKADNVSNRFYGRSVRPVARP